MKQVSIPKGYFLKHVRQEYYDASTRLIIELISNSVDAGAKNIYLTFDDNGYECLDDGCGMSQERMETAMLTFGGSAKNNNSSIGGFGNAKLIVLFAHRNYLIHSRNIIARGEVLNYQIEHTEDYLNGTRIKCEFEEGFTDLDYKARNLLKKCNTNVNIYINDQLFTEYNNLDIIKQDEFIHVLGDKKDFNTYTLPVRYNGILMFEKYVECRGNVAVELRGNPLEIFTQNRDGLKGPWAVRLDQLLQELNSDKQSFFRTIPRKTKFKGREPFYTFVSARIDEICSPIEAEALNEFLNNNVNNKDEINPVNFNNILEQHLTVAKTSNQPFEQSIPLNESIRIINEAVNKLRKSIFTIVEKYNSQLSHDFLIDVGDSNVEKIPNKFLPTTMSKRNKDIVQLWRASLENIFKNLGLDKQYIVGFVLSEDLAHHEFDDGVNIFMINPDKYLSIKDVKLRIYSIYLTAIHEIVHSENRPYHNENFSILYDDFLSKLIPNFSWRELQKKAKEI